MKAKSPDVKNIFSRSLLSCPYLDLWKAYLTFIKDVSASCRQALQLALCPHLDPCQYVCTPL